MPALRPPDGRAVALKGPMTTRPHRLVPVLVCCAFAGIGGGALAGCGGSSNADALSTPEITLERMLEPQPLSA